MSRLEDVSFDFERRNGTNYVLYDTLQSGMLGLMTVGVHRKQAINLMIQALTFVQNQAGQIPEQVLLDE